MSTATVLDGLRSPEGWAAAARAHGPRLLCALLAVGIAAQAAVLLTNYFGAAQPLASAAAEAPSAAPTHSLDLAGILNAHLFGQASPAEADASAAPQTSLALVLAGVLAEPDPQKGLALVGESAANAKVHVVGDTLPGGAKLHGIYADRVVLDRGGRLESLMLPHQSAPAGMMPAQQPISTESNIGARVRQLVQQDPQALSNVLRWQQVMNRDGHMAGVRVYPERNPAVFAKLGLRPGDLITGVNGTPLDDPSRGDEILRSLGSMPEARVTVMRSGRSTDLMLNLTQALSDAEPLLGTAGMPPVEQQPQLNAPVQ